MNLDYGMCLIIRFYLWKNSVRRMRKNSVLKLDPKFMHIRFASYYARRSLGFTEHVFCSKTVFVKVLLKSVNEVLFHLKLVSLLMLLFSCNWFLKKKITNEFLTIFKRWLIIYMVNELAPHKRKWKCWLCANSYHLYSQCLILYSTWKP